MNEQIKSGFKGQDPHSTFQKYMTEIAESREFHGMPDVYYDDGRIQWEAPSNRTGGKFKDSHHRRRDWWARKAAEIGIPTTEDRWISKTAKRIHPTKEKPCKKCGRLMDIRYVYPSNMFEKRFRKCELVDSDFDIDQLEDIYALIDRLHEEPGVDATKVLACVIGEHPSLPSLTADVEAWKSWITEVYAPSEPKTLSPGVMSNAPDRFDGFHSFNRCCRGTADKGRGKKNLRSYSTDRRVFEYWASGDWIAADRLMGIVRSEFRGEPCKNGHDGPCQADHIGPISLGFCHFPCFQLLCSACNSAKNNRMYPSDVAWLIERESKGEQIVSWHSQALWDKLKHRVETHEHALRISKVLRDNRHSYMAALFFIAQSEQFGFLASLLEMEYAERDVSFLGLRIVDAVTKYDSIQYSARTTKYVLEQKARRARIAFGELDNYFTKENRNVFLAENPFSRTMLEATIRSLRTIENETADYNRSISEALKTSADEKIPAFKRVFSEYDRFDNRVYEKSKTLFKAHMNAVADVLSEMWEDDRYVREIDDL
ncbi:type II restriction endonuclease, Alw26I/Eco31I/Esp3I family [Jannaschia faecimaris]|uniref:Type II restriction endonuclease, Alw26I/Eco31I/Esp3I family n=1 Tax=Jannaschia faecimaris TaxID=1244108 RepID=A0A1H3SKQ3_9RHOB|nr:Alw26I/Eco31I/Esp3I family type II restriction endonuclease [Jannaschia faecimaris]SDZ38317.1 type II restriction endonuclease, Alw26I/Eco31I/Esp3I family [Jannaschia faecimaris]